jgi:hypothetical protein
MELMMNEEDEAFNEIERKAKQRMEAVRAAMRGEDDDIQEYKKPWVGLTDEERNKLWRDVVGWGDPSHDDEDLMKALEAKLKEKNT